MFSRFVTKVKDSGMNLFVRFFFYAAILSLPAHVPDEACYMYLNYSFGDSNRSKFIFMTFVPDTLGGMAKSRIVGHRPAVAKFIKYSQIEVETIRLLPLLTCSGMNCTSLNLLRRL